MKKLNDLLSTILVLLGVLTFINIAIMYWVPIVLPLSSFTAVRLVVVAFIEKTYWLVLVSVLICLLIFAVAFSIKRAYIVFPLLLSGYLLWDLTTLIPLLIEGIRVRYYIGRYSLYIFIDSFLLLYLFIYSWTSLKERLRDTSTGDGLRGEDTGDGSVC